MCAEAGSYLSARGGTYVSFWLPAGLFVAVLLLNPGRAWPVLSLAVLPANLAFDFFHDAKPNLVVILLFYFANVAQSVLGAWLVRRFVAEKPSLASLKEFVGLIFLSGVCTTMLGAAIGAGTLVAFGMSQSFAQSWKVWWGSCAMAVLVLTPLILKWFASPPELKKLSFKRSGEAVLLFGGLVGLCWYLLVPGGGINSPKVSLLVFVLWAGLRFGLRGAAAAVFLLAVVMAYLTTNYLKGLSAAEIVSGEYVFTLQVFVAVAALVSMVPAIILDERDRTMLRLRDSEVRFRSLTEAAFEGIFVSENGRILDASDQGIKMFGYEREEMIGKEIITLVAPGSRAMVAEAIRNRSDAIYGHELVRKDGSTFFAEAQSKNIRQGDRSLRMTALRDITARKHAEELIAKIEAQLRSEVKFNQLLFDTSPAFIVAIGLDGKTLMMNRALLDALGYTTAEIKGADYLTTFVPDEDRATLATIFWQIINETKPTVNENRIQSRSGRTFLVEWHGRCVMHESGSQNFFVGVGTNITERKRAEGLNESQRQVLEMIANGRPWRETLDALTRVVEAQSPEIFCSILLLDADGVHIRHGAAPSLPAGLIQAIDGSAIGPCAGSCGTAAFRREPVYVADIATDPLWADYRQLALSHGLRACWSTPIFDAQRKVLGTFAIYHRQPGWPDEYSRRLVEMATHTAAVCIGKHRAEQENRESIAREQQARIQYTFQLIAAQEAERKRIAAEIHDSLGQNLLLVKNLAQMALRDQNPANAYEQLTGINHLAAQCVAEARQISRELHPYQLEHLGLKRALELLLENATQAGVVKFDWKFDEPGGNFSNADATNLYRIVQESLNNILKHSRAQNVRLRLERDIHDLQLTIADDGCGFVPENQAPGMGLKNIAERVHMLGGTFKLDSAPGRGTRIEVIIPVADAID